MSPRTAFFAVLDIINPSGKTVDELKKLSLPAGVDIVIKL